MLKLAFTAPFPIEILKPEIQLNRSIQSHPASWIQVLSAELASVEQIDLHLVIPHVAVPRDQTIRKGRITYHVIKTSPPGTCRGYGLSSSYGLFALPVIRMIRRLKVIGPDIVHGHGTEGPFSLAAVHSGFPNIVSMQGIITEIVKSEPSMYFKIAGYLERHTLRRAMAINTKTAFSEFFAKSITPQTPRFFIEAPIHAHYWTRSVPDPARNVFFVGSIIKRKGIEEWIKAFSFLSQKWEGLRGYVIGTGPVEYIHQLKEMLSSMPGGSRIEFTGQLMREEIVRLFSKGGIFCLPSYIENSPNTVMEAMAAGLPVVATDVGNLRLMVEDRKSGFLVQHCTVAPLVDAISGILGDQDLHFHFGHRGREIAAGRWNPKMVAQKHLDMYDSVLDSIPKGFSQHYPMTRS